MVNTLSIVPCDRCIETAEHCYNVFRKHSKDWGITRNGIGVMPSLRKQSKLLLYPVINRVCTFPIFEEEECDEQLLGMIHPRRPIFYCEVDAKATKAMEERKKSFRKRKRSKDTGRWESNTASLSNANIVARKP